MSNFGDYKFTCPHCGQVAKLGEVFGGIVEIATVDGVYLPNGTSASPTGTSNVDAFDQECDPYVMGYWCLACEEKAGGSLDELIENGSLVLLNPN